MACQSKFFLIVIWTYLFWIAPQSTLANQQVANTELICLDITTNFTLADEAIAQEDWTQAEKYLEQIVACLRKDVSKEVLVALVTVYLQQGKISQALKTMKKTLSFFPNDLWVFKQAVKVFYQAGQKKKAFILLLQNKKLWDQEMLEMYELLNRELHDPRLPDDQRLARG